MIWEIVTIIVLSSMGLFFIWDGYLTFRNRNKEYTDNTTGLRNRGNTSRENWQAVGGVFSGGVILLLIVYFYIF